MSTAPTSAPQAAASPPIGGLRTWFAQHGHSLRTAATRLAATPLATAFTILVIAVALSLPGGLYLVLTNLQRLAGATPAQAEISLYLKPEVDTAAARALADQLGRRPDVRAVELIERDAALERLKASGLGDVIAGLPANPLPHTLIVLAREDTPAALERLGAELARLDGIDQVGLDSDWARRLAALMQLGRDLVGVLAVLLGLALAAITGNTIRLQIYAQRDEIEVARLIGATDRFIRRPFLYFGALQGLAGGLAAWLLLSAIPLLLQDSVSSLAASYGSAFRIAGLDVQEGLTLLAASALLGWLGAHVAVTHTLRSLDIP
ncbi:MAG: permease-like cell division protein FtsX [Thiobacillaceae bacterium]|nr:permease-like cell division protein FtsX [Thiobacillaceae bacterium]MDW8323155.1 permease-like cell division protein FtsX [Burkholderiales bacterium]